jgi:hypothetical protein
MRARKLDKVLRGWHWTKARKGQIRNRTKASYGKVMGRLRAIEGRLKAG